MRLAEKVVLITGGAGGLGRAAAGRIAAEGGRLLIVDRDTAAGAETEAAIRSAGGIARFLPCDVTREAEVSAVANQAAMEYGRVDVLINSAGILQGAFQSVADLERETFERVLDVNVLGTFLFCKHVVPLIPEGGAVLCLASAGGIRGPSSSLAYGASKAAVQGFCLTLQQQLEPRGIRVNVVCPGALDTPMKRQNLRDAAIARGEDPETAAQVPLGDPLELAKVLAFLASDDAAYVTGTIFTR